MFEDFEENIVVLYLDWRMRGWSLDFFSVFFLDFVWEDVRLFVGFWGDFIDRCSLDVGEWYY